MSKNDTPYQVADIKPLMMVARTPIVDDMDMAVPLEIRTYADGWVEIDVKGFFRYCGKMSNDTLRV